MADYKRMVSYMYQYENGVKKRNVGYARIEARNGQCKFTLHMQLLGQLDSIFPVYLIQRDDKDMNLIYLGDAVLKSQIMDSKLSAEEADIMDSGYGLSDIGGILLFLNEKVFFATEWDDKAIIAEEVLNALKPKPSKKQTPVEKNEVLQEAQDTKEARVHHEADSDDKKTADLKEEADKEEKVTKKDELSADLEEKDETILVANLKSKEAIANLKEIDKNKIEVEDSIVTAPKEEASFAETGDEKTVSAIEENLLPKYKLPRGWKTVERLQYNQVQLNKPVNTAASVKPVAEQTVSPEPATQVMSNSAVVDNNQQQVNLKPEEIKKNDVSSNMEKQDVNAEVRELPDPPVAEHYFNNYPRIYPFEDNEITLCVKIEPKDIGYLSKDAWALSNNSFLLHGFYSYQHLIFAKMKDRYGCRYILGVPGIFHNREQFMARMFGFESFKSIRKRELRQGDFGYWYITISI